MVVEELDSGDAEHLALLTRPELGVTFSKLHAWRLTQYSKCVFLDADALVLQNVDELFDREELSAAPDIGWPDCFNSGVFVFEPSLETFRNLLDFARQGGSFDGELCVVVRLVKTLKENFRNSENVLYRCTFFLSTKHTVGDSKVIR